VLRLDPLFDEGVMDAAVALRAAHEGRVRAGHCECLDAGDRLGGIRIGDMLETRAMAALALHVDITGVSGLRISRRLADRIPLCAHAVAIVAESLGIAAGLERVPGAGMGRPRPLALLSDVAVSADGQMARSVVISQKASG
jgi:hypothetical protein